MDEKVKATWDDPQGAPVKKSAEAPQPPSRRMTARAPEIRQTPVPSFGRSARACRISVVSVSGPPRHRFFQGRGSLNPRRSTVFKPERSALHCCLRAHSPTLPCIFGISPAIRVNGASFVRRPLNMQSPWGAGAFGRVGERGTGDTTKTCAPPAPRIPPRSTYHVQRTTRQRSIRPAYGSRRARSMTEESRTPMYPCCQ